jgi:hypothetical protein
VPSLPPHTVSIFHGELKSSMPVETSLARGSEKEKKKKKQTKRNGTHGHANRS